MTVRVYVLIEGADDRRVIAEYTRYSRSHEGAAGVRRLALDAAGWLQLYGSHLTEEQWLHDVDRAPPRRLTESEVARRLAAEL